MLRHGNALGGRNDCFFCFIYIYIYIYIYIDIQIYIYIYIYLYIQRDRCKIIILRVVLLLLLLAKSSPFASKMCTSSHPHTSLPLLPEPSAFRVLQSARGQGGPSGHGVPQPSLFDKCHHHLMASKLKCVFFFFYFCISSLMTACVVQSGTVLGYRGSLTIIVAVK